jgi:hypothetical protein
MPDRVQLRLQRFRPAIQFLLFQFQILLRVVYRVPIRRTVATKTRPVRPVCGAEPVSPTSADVKTRSPPPPSSAEASANHASGPRVREAGYIRPGAISDCSSGHRTRTHGSGSVSSRHDCTSCFLLSCHVLHARCPLFMRSLAVVLGAHTVAGHLRGGEFAHAVRPLSVAALTLFTAGSRSTAMSSTHN